MEFLHTIEARSIIFLTAVACLASYANYLEVRRTIPDKGLWLELFHSEYWFFGDLNLLEMRMQKFLKTDIRLSTISSDLSYLEQNGLIECQSGLYFCLNSKRRAYRITDRGVEKRMELKCTYFNFLPCYARPAST